MSETQICPQCHAGNDAYRAFRLGDQTVHSCTKCGYKDYQSQTQEQLNPTAAAVPTDAPEEELVTFNCPHCSQMYEAPVEMADTRIDCQACHKSIQVPRPKRGYYAGVTEPQMEQAELYGIFVPPEMFRGQLKELIDKSQSDTKNLPSPESWEQYKQRQSERRIRDARAKVAEAERAIEEGSDLKAASQRRLQKELERAQDALDSALEGERDRRDWVADMKKIDEQNRRAEEADQKWIRRELYEEPFSRGGDWNSLYKKPSRSQYQAVYAWLDQNRPGWRSVGDVVDAIDVLFPELKK